MDQYDTAYKRATTSYYKAGANTPLHEMRLDWLDSAQSVAATIPYPNAQELCGWANVEMLFPTYEGENVIPPEEVYGRATEAFGRAYDLYQEEGFELPLRRLEITHATLPLYQKYAANEDVTAEEKQSVLRQIAGVGKTVIEMAEQQDDFLGDGRAANLCAETITILGMSLKRGDTRKPVDTLVLPSTLRQRLTNVSRSQLQARGREKWDLTRISRTANDWTTRAKIAFDTKQNRSEGVPFAEGITQISEDLHLTNGVHDTIFTLRAVIAQVEGRADATEAAFAKEVGARLLRITK